jgi:cytoskeletal protein CcmA (bactofilin family)
MSKAAGMSREDANLSAPTMIIPKGTQIEVDQHGQLSIRTPGNLVIQNSGIYGTIESVRGSVRIEPKVEVEAVTVRCAKACYVQGSLTAWKVEAEAIELEESARAHIMLQQTQSLHVGRRARLVGNFASEKELFLLFSRFARQMRALPFGFDRSRAEPEEAPAPLGSLEPMLLPPGSGEAERPRVDAADGELPDALFFAMVLLEREFEKSSGGPTQRRVVQELLRLLRAHDIEQLRRSYDGLVRQLVHPSEDLRRVRELLQSYFS